MPGFGRGPGGPSRGRGNMRTSTRSFGRGPAAGPRPMAYRPPMPRPIRRMPMPPPRYYRPRLPLVVPVPFYPPVTRVVPVQAAPFVPAASVDFSQVLGQLNYLMDAARQNAAVDTQDIVTLSEAIQYAQNSDANGLLNALHRLSNPLVVQARDLGMAYLVELAGR